MCACKINKNETHTKNNDLLKCKIQVDHLPRKTALLHLMVIGSARVIKQQGIHKKAWLGAGVGQKKEEEEEDSRGDNTHDP